MKKRKKGKKGKRKKFKLEALKYRCEKNKKPEHIPVPNKNKNSKYNLEQSNRTEGLILLSKGV